MVKAPDSVVATMGRAIDTAFTTYFADPESYQMELDPIDNVQMLALGAIQNEIKKPSVDASQKVVEAYFRHQLENASAERFLGFAFREGRRLIRYAGQHVVQSELAGNPNDLLKRSKVPLLKVARLDDTLKVAFFDDVLGGFSHNPPRLEYDGEKQQLGWKSEVRQWIENRLELGSGCPASKIIVPTETGNTTLLYNFWDRLVDVAYPPEN